LSAGFAQAGGDSNTPAHTGNFTIAQAFGNGAVAYAGAVYIASGLDSVKSYFDFASAIGTGAVAEAINGSVQSGRALGDYSKAISIDGNFNVARTIGGVSEAYAQGGSGNIAVTIGTLSSARAGSNGYANPTGSNRNSALVIGDNSRATAGVAPGAPAGSGPVSGRHVVVIGTSRTKSDEADVTSSQRTARSAAARRH
jgi:hypothetical protein